VDFGSSDVSTGDFNAESCELKLTSDSSLVTNNLKAIDSSLTIVDPTTPTIISKITTTMVGIKLTIENQDGSWEGKSFPILSFNAGDVNLQIEFSEVHLFSEGSEVSTTQKRDCKALTHQIEDSPPSGGLTTRSVVFTYSDCEPVDGGEGESPGDIVLIVVGVLAIVAIIIGIVAVIVYYQSKRKPAIGADGYYSNL
jgi:hypothetical protein